MLSVAASDDAIEPLEGYEVLSPFAPGVTYRIGRALGEGGMCIAFYALRVAPEGECPVVLKIVRPSFVRESKHATLIVQKEVVALGRLNERVPPTPFVVRLVDAGTLPIEHGRRVLELPWLVVEYVHGGAEGTTLTARVRHTVRTTGFAFDPARAANAIDCLARALGAVHDVGVIHRDVKPDNVLCCGFGDSELFKVADFGVARPAGLVGTFQGALAGTPGFAPPELQGEEPGGLGPSTDVFSMAPTIYFLLTGEEYFRARTPLEHIACVASPERRSILDARSLSPALRAREDVCRGVDAELARAGSLHATRRHQSANELGAVLLRWLDVGSRWGRAFQRISDTVLLEVDAEPAQGWSWTRLQRPGRLQGLLRSVAWDADGRCLAAHDAGLSFWDGTTWHDVSTEKLPSPAGLRFVHRSGPGRWILGGDSGLIAAYTTNGVEDVITGADPGIAYRLFSGAIDDLGVVVGGAAGGPPLLFALAGRWWLKPLPLADAPSITSLARYDQERWLIAGADRSGAGFAASYAPLNWEMERIDAGRSRAFAACAGNPDRRVGVAVGAGGAVVLCSESATWVETVSGAPDLTAVGVDEQGGVWVGGGGRLYRRLPGGRGSSDWESVWEDPGWTAPFVSILAGSGYVLAITADGGVLEGRQIDMKLVSA